VLAICLGLAVATVITYWPVTRNEFVDYDDGRYVRDNAVVKKGLTAEGLRYAFTTREGGNWHPLIWISHMVDVEVWGMNPGGHHASNVAYHALNAVLLFVALLHLTGALWPSAFVAAAFALHPLHVESVAWAAERKDTLSTLFWMTTLLAYSWYARRPSPGRYAVVFASFVCGIMSKPMLVTLPLVLLLLDFWPLRRVPGTLAPGSGASGVPARSLGTLVAEKVPMLALVVVIIGVTLSAQREAGAVASSVAFPLGLRLENAILAYVLYLGKMVWPTNLTVLYPYAKTVPALGVVAAFVVLVTVTAAALRFARRVPYLAVGWLWYVGTLVPVIGIIQVGHQPWADRYTYVPLVGIFIAIAWGLFELLPARPVRTALAVGAAAVLLVWSVVAQAQVRNWKDTQTLYEHTLRATTDNYVIQYNLGKVLQDKKQIDQAIEHYVEAARISPNFPPPHNNLGILFADRGRTKEAIEHYTVAARFNPRDPDVHNNLANALSTEGRYDEADQQFRESLRLKPAAGTYSNAALNLIRAGRFADAATTAETAVKMDPRNAQAQNNLATALAKQGKPTEAIGHYREAMRLMPGWPPAERRLAWVLATYPDASVRNASEAVTLARHANERTNDRDPEILDTLAAATAEAGQLGEAADIAERAASLADAAGKAQLAAQIRARAALYRAGQPYRDTVAGDSRAS
jgi:protein O-mannosyl-transferase